VKSIRGAGGGYILARHPEDIKLREILMSLEGSCCLVECVEDEDYCDKIDRCAAYDIWKGASSLLKDYFEKTTLQDLVKISDKKNSAMQK
jgi:Rrf2 family protein